MHRFLLTAVKTGRLGVLPIKIYQGNNAVFVSVDLIGEKNQVILEWCLYQNSQCVRCPVAVFETSLVHLSCNISMDTGQISPISKLKFHYSDFPSSRLIFHFGPICATKAIYLDFLCSYTVNKLSFDFKLAYTDENVSTSDFPSSG